MKSLFAKRCISILQNVVKCGEAYYDVKGAFIQKRLRTNTLRGLTLIHNVKAYRPTVGYRPNVLCF